MVVHAAIDTEMYLDDALENVPEPDLEADMAVGRAFTITDEPDDDLQASLGQKAHE